MIYEDIRDIPLEQLSNGGTFQIVHGVPPEVLLGRCFGAIDESIAKEHGVYDQAMRDENGDIVKLTGSNYDPNAHAPGYSVFSAGSAPGLLGWDWLVYIIIAIAVIASIIASVVGTGGIAAIPWIFIGFMAFLAVGTYAVSTIWAPKYAVESEKFADGSFNTYSADGSIIHWNADGTWSIIKGPDPPPFGDLGKIVKYAVIAGAVIGVGYVGMQAYSSIKHKQPFKAPAIDYAVKGVSDIGSSGAKAVGRLAA